jgi:hypothetical protein
MCEYNCTHLFYIAFHFAHKDEVVVSITVFKCFVGSNHMEHNFALPGQKAIQSNLYDIRGHIWDKEKVVFKRGSINMNFFYMTIVTV